MAGTSASGDIHDLGNGIIQFDPGGADSWFDSGNEEADMVNLITENVEGAGKIISNEANI